ncbi:MAG: c-type cytochrome [Halopseudomonas yangmingensis]
MKLTALLAAVGTAALLAAPLAQANEGEKLFRSNPCVACHMPSSPAVGPSLDQLAERYKGADEDTLNTVASHIVAGSGGVWGPIPMPPNAVDQDQARTILDWIIER